MSNWLHPDNSHEFTTAMAYWLLDGVTSNNSSCQYCKPPISPTRSNAYKENEAKLFIKMSNLNIRGRRRLEKRLKNKLNNRQNSPTKISILLDNLEICEKLQKWLNEPVQ
tara:strand:- start:171 stop:500 length:330 start_codon:yes stop_codon:yes gene_type:complete